MNGSKIEENGKITLLLIYDEISWQLPDMNETICSYLFTLGQQAHKPEFMIRGVN